MDLLSFAAKALEALAWPVAAVILVFLLRSEIQKLAPMLKRIKAGPLEAEFDREVRELKASTAESPTSAPLHKPDVASREFLLQLAQLHPRSAITESWVRVEAAARAALARKAPTNSMSTYVPAARLTEPLAQQELLHQGQVTLFHELRRLRNDVAHSPELEPSLGAAHNYIELASFLQGCLEEAAQ